MANCNIETLFLYHCLNGIRLFHIAVLLSFHILIYYNVAIM